DGSGKGDAETGGHHLEVVGRWRVLQLLHVGGDDDRGHRSLGQGGTHRPDDDVGQLFGDAHHLAELGSNVLVEVDQVDLLLVGATHGGPVGLSHDRHHRDMVQFGVVETVEQVNPAGAGRGGAHPDL